MDMQVRPNARELISLYHIICREKEVRFPRPIKTKPGRGVYRRGYLARQS